MNRAYRGIIMGAFVIAMAFTLRTQWMIVMQSALGGWLIGACMIAWIVEREEAKTHAQQMADAQARREALERKSLEDGK